LRNHFANKLLEVMNHDDKIVLLSGDIGNNLFSEHKRRFCSRFINTGIAEQNQVLIASGMSAMGMIPVLYTITPFITTRVLEQVKLDLAYSNRKALIVGTGSGLSYYSLGVTHFSLEDVAIMTAIPGISVLAPCDLSELDFVLSQSSTFDQLMYLRLGKKGEHDLQGIASVDSVALDQFRRRYSASAWNISNSGKAFVCSGPNVDNIIYDLFDRDKVNFSVYSLFGLGEQSRDFFCFLYDNYEEIIFLDFAWGAGSIEYQFRIWCSKNQDGVIPRIVGLGPEFSFSQTPPTSTFYLNQILEVME